MQKPEVEASLRNEQTCSSSDPITNYPIWEYRSPTPTSRMHQPLGKRYYAKQTSRSAGLRGEWSSARTMTHHGCEINPVTKSWLRSRIELQDRIIRLLSGRVPCVREIESEDQQWRLRYVTSGTAISLNRVRVGTLPVK